MAVISTDKGEALTYRIKTLGFNTMLVFNGIWYPPPQDIHVVYLNRLLSF